MMNNSLRLLLQATAMIVLLVGTSAVSAQTVGDAEKGKVLAYSCLGCHGIEGYRNAYPAYRVPKLGGQQETYIQIALKAYRSGERSHATMRAQAGSLSDQDIADLAAYFASRGEVQEGDVVTAGVTKGKEKSQACVACHGEKGVSNNEIWPNLAGQHKDYIVAALRQYRLANAEESGGENVRKNAVMAGLAGALSDDDIEALAAYFSAQKGLYTTQHEK
ncbi:MAG: c-type cytochrome [Pseudomonadota bacterium]